MRGFVFALVKLFLVFIFSFMKWCHFTMPELKQLPKSLLGLSGLEMGMLSSFYCFCIEDGFANAIFVKLYSM